MLIAANVAKTARWGLTSAALFFAAVYLLTTFFYVTYYWASGDVRSAAGASAGLATYDRSEYGFRDKRGLKFMRGAAPHTWRNWKFYYIDSHTSHGAQFTLAVPLWAPLAATAFPALLLWRPVIRAARRKRAGQCVGCGYDRAGLLATSPCPECGEKPAGG